VAKTVMAAIGALLLSDFGCGAEPSAAPRADDELMLLVVNARVAAPMSLSVTCISLICGDGR
jgi:hypothetical protein